VTPRQCRIPSERFETARCLKLLVQALVSFCEFFIFLPPFFQRAIPTGRDFVVIVVKSGTDHSNYDEKKQWATTLKDGSDTHNLPFGVGVAKSMPTARRRFPINSAISDGCICQPTNRLKSQPRIARSKEFLQLRPTPSSAINTTNW
jgi:hypothetical protein